MLTLHILLQNDDRDAQLNHNLKAYLIQVMMMIVERYYSVYVLHVSFRTFSRLEKFYGYTDVLLINNRDTQCSSVNMYILLQKVRLR